MTPRLALRPGFTLIEVMVALTVMAIIGAAATGMLINQSRLFDQQEKLSGARQVSRGAVNLLMAELRMVEVGGGVLGAGPDSITLRLPYAIGLVCGSNASATRTVVSVLPVDSATFGFATANYSGWARRGGHDGTDGYVYASNTPRSVTPGGPTATCGTAGITTLPGGRVLELEPHVSTATVGVPMFLFQTVTYKFAPSASVPGTRALWRRTDTAGNQPVEILAPFTDAARFRFYLGTAQAAVDATGPLTDVRGVELVLTGRSESRTVASANDRAFLTTGVFFQNRLD
jgi:prepilin-type N-terminal cleavage/methylation domain-containing protein